MGAREYLFANDAPRGEVELGGEVIEIRSLSTRGRDKAQRAFLEGGSAREIMLREMCYVKATGEPLFTDEDDVGAIPAEKTEPLVDAIVELAPLSVEDQEELVGN